MHSLDNVLITRNFVRLPSRIARFTNRVRERTFLWHPRWKPSEKERHTERRGIIYQGCAETRIENRSCLSCFACARNRCVLFVVSARSLRHHRERRILGKRRVLPLTPFNFRPFSRTTTYITQACLKVLR